MTTTSLTTIAQLPCYQDHPLPFAKLVGVVRRHLADLVEHPFTTSRETDDLVILDQRGTRVLLAWTVGAEAVPQGVLTLSVGPSPAVGKPVLRPDHAPLCEHLAAALQRLTGPGRVQWHKMACTMSSEWVELLSDALPGLQAGHAVASEPIPGPGQLRPARTVDRAAMPPRTARPAAADTRIWSSDLTEALRGMDSLLSLTEIPEARPAWPDPSGPVAANVFGSDAETAEGRGDGANFLRVARRSQLAQSRIIALRRRAIRTPARSLAASWRAAGVCDPSLAALRHYIYTPDARDEPPPPSTHLRLATHAITLTLVATALPVGAAMMTYNLLRGEDIRATAHMTTLTGLGLAVLAGNPGLAQLIGA